MKNLLSVMLSIILSFSSGFTVNKEESFADFTQEDIQMIETMDKLNIDTNDLLFIGNSLTYGMSTVAKENNFIAKSGINFKKMREDGYYYQLRNYNCNNVLIAMGTNELGWYSEKMFKDEYQKLINEIKNINSNSNIICITIPPVSAYKSSSNSSFTNGNVQKYNKYIEDIVNENNLNIVYSNQYFGDVLSSNMTPDGIHLYSSGYKGWYDFIKNKVAEL